MDNAQAQNIFPPDVIARAKKYLAAIPGGTGAYSDSRGAMVLRQDIAKVGHLEALKGGIVNVTIAMTVSE